MSRILTKVLAAAALLQGAVMVQEAFAEKATPGFNNKIPESVLTPDTVETKIGTLKFFDGIPNKKAAAALFDNLDNGDVRPGDQAGTTPLFSLKGGPKGAPEGFDIAGQPVHRQQQLAAQRNLANLVGQFLDQIQVALGTNGPAQP